MNKPGQAGEFDFLNGHWQIENERLLPNGEWDVFPGEARCWSILDGRASIEELSIPARNFSGMGLRILEAEAAVWQDFWVNAKSGLLTTPGMPGSFAGGVGTFICEEEDEQGKLLIRSLWQQDDADHCRWSQASSRDGGASWQDNWRMRWTRLAST